jgi:hypothetical protein
LEEAPLTAPPAGREFKTAAADMAVGQFSKEGIMTPNITEESASLAVRSLSALPNFPEDPVARAEIGNLILRMCTTAEEAQWLVRRTFDLWSQWEGPRELRAILCARFKPKDGIEVNYSRVFADGIVPSEKP